VGGYIRPSPNFLIQSPWGGAIFSRPFDRVEAPRDLPDILKDYKKWKGRGSSPFSEWKDTSLLWVVKVGMVNSSISVRLLVSILWYKNSQKFNSPNIDGVKLMW